MVGAGSNNTVTRRMLLLFGLLAFRTEGPGCKVKCTRRPLTLIIGKIQIMGMNGAQIIDALKRL